MLVFRRPAGLDWHCLMPIRFDSRPLVFRRAYTATIHAGVSLQWRDHLSHALHLFFVIAAAVVSRNVANQQVLDVAGAEILGSLYVAVAISTGSTIAAVGWFARNLSAQRVAGVIHIFTAVSIGAAFMSPQNDQIAAVVVYMAMELNGALLLLAFGIILGASLGPREARRVAARVGAGGILGGLVAGALLSLMATFLGSRYLYLLAGVFALAPIFFLPQSHGAVPRIAVREQQLQLSELRRYGLWVAITTFLMVVTTTFVDYQFRYAAAEQFSTDKLTAFFGYVVLLAGATTILFQVTFLHRLLDRWGLFATAAVMPLALMLGAGAFGLLPGVATLVALKTIDSGANMSVQQATGGLLLAPLSVRSRSIWQGRIDGLAKRGGQVVTGVLLATLSLTDTQVVPVVVVLCGLWLAAIVLTRTHYVSLLTAMLHKPNPVQPELQIYDRASVRLLEGELENAPLARAAVILELLQRGEQRASDAALGRLAKVEAEGSGEGARLVIDHLASFRDTATLERFCRHANTDVAAAAILALDEVDPTRGDDVAQATYRNPGAPEELRALSAALLTGIDEEARQITRRMASSPTQSTRLAVAQALNRIEPGAPQEVGRILCLLCEDESDEVARAALGAVGRHLSSEACAVALRGLSKRPLRGAAMRALTELGTPVVAPVTEALQRYLREPSIAQALCWILGQIGSSKALQPLINALLAQHPMVRLSAAVALTALRRRRQNLALPVANIEAVFLPEIAYYRMSRAGMRCGLPTSPAGKLLRRTLQQRSRSSLETLFRLFSLCYAENSIQGAYAAINSSERRQRQIALELLDTLLVPEVRQALGEAIDEGVDGKPGMSAVEILSRFSRQQDKMVAFLAKMAIAEMSGTLAAATSERSQMQHAHIDQLLELQSISLFSQSSAEDLQEVASFAVHRDVAKGTVFFHEGEPGDAMYILRQGAVALRKQGKTIDHIKEGDAFGVVSVLDRLPREVTATASSACAVWSINSSDLHQLLADRPLLMHSIFRALTTALREQIQRTALGKRAS